MSQLWINGALADKAEARVSPFDHGLLYGDGVWEHLRLFGGKPFAAEHHLRILSDAANALGIDIPLSHDELLAAIDATAKANARTEGYVRIIVTRGPGTVGPDPRKIEPQVIVIAEEYQPFPQELYGHGLHAVVAATLDLGNPAFRHRTLNQLHVVQAKRYALQSGCLEGLFQRLAPQHLRQPIIGSTEGWLFTIKDGTVAVACPELSEATASAVVDMAIDSGRVVTNSMPELKEVLEADEVFIAGTACGVIGVVRVEGQDIGDGTEGPVTRDLRERFERLTRGGAG
jgi:branched-chain amino acid aminotransferase